jgi:hypothetical protein
MVKHLRLPNQHEVCHEKHAILWMEMADLEAFCHVPDESLWQNAPAEMTEAKNRQGGLPSGGNDPIGLWISVVKTRRGALSSSLQIRRR